MDRVVDESNRLMPAATRLHLRAISERMPVSPSQLQRLEYERRASPSRRALVASSLTRQEAEVLAMVLETDCEETYGYELAQRCGTPPSSMYKALGRLEQNGLVRSRDEDVREAERARRPQRRLYSLTGEGESELARWRAAQLMRSASARLLH